MRSCRPTELIASGEISAAAPAAWVILASRQRPAPIEPEPAELAAQFAGWVAVQHRAADLAREPAAVLPAAYLGQGAGAHREQTAQESVQVEWVQAPVAPRAARRFPPPKRTRPFGLCTFLP